jgi:hypothetical protein
VLSLSGAICCLADRQASTGLSPTWYGSVEEFLDSQHLSSILLLVVRWERLPKGTLLLTLGRLAQEYPAMRKIVLMAGPPPLPIALYLTACGVDMIWANINEQLDTVVRGLSDRADGYGSMTRLTPCQPRRM